MRYIDISEIQLSTDWKEKAAKALAKIKALPSTQRSIAIKANSDVWNDPALKSALMDLSHDKCWYCETRQERSFNDVDHFRPKNKVAECKDHGGYWWLAFDYTNYRFSCNLCNRRKIDEKYGTDGGKATHFPLLDETKRASDENCDIEDEEPCLLDPTKAMDPGLLWFDQDGNIAPRFAEMIHPEFYKRAQDSIYYYHLHHHDLITKRLTLYNYIARKVSAGRRYFNQCMGGDATAKHPLNEVAHELIKLTQPNAEYSAAAKAYIMGFREPGNEWLDLVINSL